MNVFFLIVLGLALWAVIRQKTWKAQPWPTSALKPPPYQGHRGYWKGGMQENTLKSFAAAAERGLKMVELDVRLSADGVPVVFHDLDLIRLGNKNTKKVSELSVAELNQLVQAPRLEDVLADSSLPKFINIELKTNSVFDGSLEKAVAKVVRRKKAEARILFSSFNPVSLWRLSHLLPEVPRALLATKEKAPGNRIYLRRLWLAPFINIHALHLDERDVTAEDIKRWKSRGVPVAVWTVNDSKKAEELLEAGALSIISDTLGGPTASSSQQN